MVDSWDGIQIDSKVVPDKFMHNPKVGEPYNISVTLSNVAMENSIGIELVLNFQKQDGSHVIKTVELNQVRAENGTVTFETEYSLRKAGIFNYAFRMFPKNADLPHRQDLCYVRWF
jgi:starch phosphorylase